MIASPVSRPLHHTSLDIAVITEREREREREREKERKREKTEM